MAGVADEPLTPAGPGAAVEAVGAVEAFAPRPGGAAPVAAAGPLARLWRNVYRKAAQVAEARAGALLAGHVYHLHGQRAVTVVLDGGGATPSAGTKADLALPWAYQLEGWTLYADQPGSAIIDLLRSVSYDTFPGDLASICGGARPELAGAQKAQSDDLTGWTAQLPRGTVLRVRLESASAVLVVTLTLYLRAL